MDDMEPWTKPSGTSFWEEQDPPNSICWSSFLVSLTAIRNKGFPRVHLLALSPCPSSASRKVHIQFQVPGQLIGDSPVGLGKGAKAIQGAEGGGGF